MPDTDPETQKLFEQVLDKVQKIYDEFAIVSSQVEDYDKYGPKVEVECANGWIGWSWDLKHLVKDRKELLCASISAEGVVNDRGDIICLDNNTIHHWVFDFFK
jgi:hypothetical protein